MTTQDERVRVAFAARMKQHGLREPSWDYEGRVTYGSGKFDQWADLRFQWFEFGYLAAKREGGCDE